MKTLLSRLLDCLIPYRRLHRESRWMGYWQVNHKTGERTWTVEEPKQ